ncbi:MAG: thioesterase family protein [Sediminibacterium sp.]|nr:thioesterase family protein [Sediminibacterium sp.]
MNFYEFQEPYRVRYADTDQMRVVYYGNYCKFMEIGRVEALRNLGLSYKQFEEEGFGLAVINMNITYKHPAIYDDLIQIKTIIPEFPSKNELIINHEIFNSQGRLLTTATVTLFYINLKTFKRTELPTILENIFKNHQLNKND